MKHRQEVAAIDLRRRSLHWERGLKRLDIFFVGQIHNVSLFVNDVALMLLGIIDLTNRRIINLQMQTKTKKTYMGFTALLTGIVSVLFLGANFSVSQLDITPSLFNQLNIWTALLYCVTTPLSFGLGFLGMIRKADSKTLSLMAMALVTIPFGILFTQLASAFLGQ